MFCDEVRSANLRARDFEHATEDGGNFVDDRERIKKREATGDNSQLGKKAEFVAYPSLTARITDTAGSREAWDRSPDCPLLIGPTALPT